MPIEAWNMLMSPVHFWPYLPNTSYLCPPSKELMFSWIWSKIMILHHLTPKKSSTTDLFKLNQVFANNVGIAILQTIPPFITIFMGGINHQNWWFLTLLYPHYISPHRSWRTTAQAPEFLAITERCSRATCRSCRLMACRGSWPPIGSSHLLVETVLCEPTNSEKMW